MSQIMLFHNNTCSVLGAPIDVDGSPLDIQIPARSPLRPVLTISNNTKEFLPNGYNDNDLFNDMSSNEFVLDGYASPRDSLFSIPRNLPPKLERNDKIDKFDSIDYSEIDSFLDEPFEIELCVVDDLMSILRNHNQNDQELVRFISQTDQ